MQKYFFSKVNHTELAIQLLSSRWKHLPFLFIFIKYFLRFCLDGKLWFLCCYDINMICFNLNIDVSNSPLVEGEYLMTDSIELN